MDSAHKASAPPWSTMCQLDRAPTILTPPHLSAEAKPQHALSVHPAAKESFPEHFRVHGCCVSSGAPLFPPRDIDKKPQHVVCHVQGMDCTSCEAKLRRVTESICEVSNVSVSFLGCRLEFDLCQTLSSVTEVLESMSKKSGFILSQLEVEYSVVKVALEKHLPAKTLAADLMRTGLCGLIDVRILTGHIAHITYDPEVVGIRDLLAMVPGQRIAVTPDPGLQLAGSSVSQTLKRPAFKTLLAVIFTIPVTILSFGAADFSKTKAGAVTIMGLASVVQIIAIVEFYFPAFYSLVECRVLELDMLMVLSTSAAFVYSVIEFTLLMIGRPLPDGTSGYSATSCLLITFVLLGHLIADYARSTAVHTVSTLALQERKATLLNQDGSATTVDCALLQNGDCFSVPPNGRIPTDGVVVCGQSEVDESVLTGESLPSLKTVGSNVLAGTVNRSATLHIKLTKLPGRNTISEIADLLDRANIIRPKIQSAADRVAQGFIPLVLSVAAISLFVWLVIEVKAKHNSGWTAVGNAVTYPIAVLAVSCPCALALAVPIVLVVTAAIAARSGVIVKSAQAIEQSWQVTDVVFDKTGTLTLPDVEVTDEYILDHANQLYNATSLALGLTNGVQHPLSISLNRHLAKHSSAEVANVRDISVFPGSGISGKLDGSSAVQIGSPAWLGFTEHDIVRHLTQDSKAVVCLTKASKLVAIFGLRTTLRPEALGVVSALKDRGLAIHLLSGDGKGAVHSAAKSLGIDMHNVRHGHSPADKQAYVHSLSAGVCSDHACLESKDHHHQLHHHRHSRRKVMFIGDGTNDALALASAHVGVQVGNASDALGSSAAVTLLGPLTGITQFLDLSRAARRRVMFNFVWSAVYNVFAISLAAGVAVKWRIPPRYAGLGELISVLPVILVGASMILVKKTLKRQ